jgi:hypothetical protein
VLDEGDAHEAGPGVHRDAKLERIGAASVIIKGTAIGSLDSNDVTTIDIEAQQLSSIKLGGAKGPLIAGG